MKVEKESGKAEKEIDEVKEHEFLPFILALFIEPLLACLGL